MFTGGCIEQRRIDTGFYVARQQRAQDFFGTWLKLIGARRTFGFAIATLHGLALKRDERPTHHFLRACRDKAGVHQLHSVDLFFQEQIHDVLTDGLGVFILRCIGKTSEWLHQGIATELEIVLALATHWHDGVRLVGQYIGLDFTFGGSQHASVVAAAQPAVSSNRYITGGLDHITWLQECRLGT